MDLHHKLNPGLATCVGQLLKKVVLTNPCLHFSAPAFCDPRCTCLVSIPTSCCQGHSVHRWYFSEHLKVKRLDAMDFQPSVKVWNQTERPYYQIYHLMYKNAIQSSLVFIPSRILFKQSSKFLVVPLTKQKNPTLFKVPTTSTCQGLPCRIWQSWS